MARPCSICAHPKRAEIDAALVGGEPNRRVASRHGIIETSIRRHREHIPEKIAKRAESKEIKEAGGLLEEVTRLRDEAQRLGKLAEETGDLKTALAAVREQTRIVELLAEVAKTAAEASAKEHVSLSTSPEWIELQARMLDALAPFPDARQALSGALANG